MGWELGYVCSQLFYPLFFRVCFHPDIPDRKFKRSENPNIKQLALDGRMITVWAYCVALEGLEGTSGGCQIRSLSPGKANFKVTSGCCSGCYPVNFFKSPRTDVPQHLCAISSQASLLSLYRRSPHIRQSFPCCWWPLPLVFSPRMSEVCLHLFFLSKKSIIGFSLPLLYSG